MEKEYSLEEISKKYGVHIETVRRWVRSGTLKAHKKVGCGKGGYVYENDLAIFVHDTEGTTTSYISTNH